MIRTYAHIWNDKKLLQKTALVSTSCMDMLSKLDVKVNNGNAGTLKSKCKEFGIEVPLWNRSVAATGNKNSQKLTAESVLKVGNRIYGARILKKFMSAAGINISSCNTCGQNETWNDLPLVLQVDHINGNRFDNRLINLRILCPHCHTQTDTYANNRRNETTKSKYAYCTCGSRKLAKSTLCAKCSARMSKPQRTYPPVSEIVARVSELNSFSAVCKELRVSDAALKKYLRRNGIEVRDLVYSRKHRPRKVVD